MTIDMPGGQWINVADVDYDYYRDRITVIDDRGRRFKLDSFPNPRYMREALEVYGFIDSEAPVPV
jgi:hypothetical protein